MSAGRVDAALVQQILGVSQRQWEADVHHDRHANDLGRRLEVTERAGLAHAQRLGAALPRSRRVALTPPPGLIELGVRLPDTQAQSVPL